MRPSSWRVESERHSRGRQPDESDTPRENDKGLRQRVRVGGESAYIAAAWVNELYLELVTIRALRASDGDQEERAASPPNHPNARKPGRKQYSPPRFTTNRDSPDKRRRIGRLGMSNVPPPPDAMGSFMEPPPKKLPSFIHSDCTNSNCLERCAPTKAKINPRSTPSSPSTPSGSGGPYEVPRRIIR